MSVSFESVIVTAKAGPLRLLEHHGFKVASHVSELRHLLVEIMVVTVIRCYIDAVAVI
jgi:hypothetical protein